jgi:hypothetical protein
VDSPRGVVRAKSFSALLLFGVLQSVKNNIGQIRSRAIMSLPNSARLKADGPLSPIPDIEDL